MATATRSSTQSAPSSRSAAAGARARADGDHAGRYYRIPRRLVHRVLGALFFGTLLLAVALALVLRGAGDYLVVSDPLPAHADAIVVLGGGGADGNRETQAAKLFKAGLAPVVVTTGGPVVGEPAPATYAEWAVQRLVRRGVPRAAVQPTDEGDSTLGDARGALHLAERNGWRSLVLVTDSWHTRRVRLIFDDVFRGRPVQLYVSPAPSGGFDAAAWWRDDVSALPVLTEYVKLAAYYFTE